MALLGLALIFTAVVVWSFIVSPMIYGTEEHRTNAQERRNEAGVVVGNWFVVLLTAFGVIGAIYWIIMAASTL